MKASSFLKMFGWCGASISPVPNICIEFNGEFAELYLCANGAVKWRWKNAQQDINVDLQTAANTAMAK
jgi:hypothetical protein